MPTKKVLIFDIDGTAVDSPNDQLPTQRLKDAMFARMDEFFFVAATGRPYPFAKPVLEFLELTTPCIVSGGTQICESQSGQILKQSNIPPENLDIVMNILKRYDDYGLVINDFTEEDYHNGGAKPSEIKLPEEVYYMDFTYLPDGLALEICYELRKIETITCSLAIAHKPNTKDVHITNSDATKEHAIAEVLSMLAVDKKDTIGVGDGGNDIHLFNAVHQKIAMTNAVEELKDLADKVIGPVHNDGLAEFIEHL